jgi:hypothetical protein
MEVENAKLQKALRGVRSSATAQTEQLRREVCFAVWL